MVVVKYAPLKPLVLKGCSVEALNRSLRRLNDLTNAMAWGYAKSAHRAIERLLDPSRTISLLCNTSHLLDKSKWSKNGMITYILVLALWDGSEWAVQRSEWQFRKQEVCQQVGKQLTRKHDNVKHYRCIQRTRV